MQAHHPSGSPLPVRTRLLLWLRRSLQRSVCMLLALEKDQSRSLPGTDGMESGVLQLEGSHAVIASHLSRALQCSRCRETPSSALRPTGNHQHTKLHAVLIGRVLGCMH